MDDTLCKLFRLQKPSQVADYVGLAILPDFGIVVNG